MNCDFGNGLSLSEASPPRTARIAAIFTHLVNFCWSLFKWCLLLLFLAVAGVGGYLYFKLDDEIRRQVEFRFASHYKDFHVQVGSARFDPERGIEIDDFSLTPKTADGSVAEPVLSIDQLYLSGKLRVEQLLTNQLQIADVLVRRAKLRMVRQADGQWNAAALLPLPHFSDQCPTITIENASGTIQYPGSSGNKTWSLKGVDLKLSPMEAASCPVNALPHFHIEGTANGLPAREFRVSGELGAGDGVLDVTLTTTGLDLTPQLLANLSSDAAAKLNGMEFSGLTDLAMRLKRRDASSPFSWSARFRVDRGRFQHPSLPDALTDVSIVGEADPTRLTIHQIDSKWGPATLRVALNRAGWAANAPLAVKAKVDGFYSTEKLASILPESKARIWQRFRPVGPVDAEIQLTYDGIDWKPSAKVVCRGLTLTDQEKFPYLLQQTTGEVTYGAVPNSETDRLHLDLTGIAAGRPIKVLADLTHLSPGDPQGPEMGEGVAMDATTPDARVFTAGYRGARVARGRRAGFTHPLGFVEVSGVDIPLHDQLVAALSPSPKAKSLVESLHGQGMVDFRFRAEWKDLSQRQAEVSQDIRLKECRINYGPFPFPLQHVQGLVTERNGEWLLNDLEARGSNDSTVVRCRGVVRPKDSGSEVDLTFDATSVPLDENLKQALSPPGQKAWDELSPQGSINFMAHVARQPNELEPNVEVRLRPQGKSVSIEPRMFPYRLGELDGEATYKRGRVDWRNVIARHDHSIYSVESGSWQVTAEEGWQCTLANVNVDRLMANRDLVLALPPGVQSVIDKLQPSGTIGLYNGNFSFAKSPQSPALAAAWDISLECQQAAIQGATPIQGITGGIRLVGQSDGRNAFSAGALALDSILWKDTQLTNVRGPFWADSTHVLLGEPASVQQRQQPQRLTADAYGGSVAANVELVHDVIPSYKADVQLGAANLSRFINERLGGPHEMNGTVSGRLVVTGTGASPQTMRGGGDLHVVDAKIYELPVLVGLLKVLKNRTPDTTAFNRCDMKFAIQGEHVHFDQLNLRGDAVSLYGNGEMDLNQRLDLTFYTMIGPADLPIPLWRTIAGNVSQQGLQLKVGGTLEHAEIEKKALPAVNDMITQIQNELQQEPPPLGAASTAERGTRPPSK